MEGPLCEPSLSAWSQDLRASEAARVTAQRQAQESRVARDMAAERATKLATDLAAAQASEAAALEQAKAAEGAKDDAVRRLAGEATAKQAALRNAALDKVLPWAPGGDAPCPVTVLFCTRPLFLLRPLGGAAQAARDELVNKLRVAETALAAAERRAAEEAAYRVDSVQVQPWFQLRAR